MKANQTSLLLATVLLSLSSLSKADNLIELDQGSYQGHTGDNFDLQIVQKGADNKIQCHQDTSCWITGDDFDIHLEQYNTSGTDNVIEIWHLEGDGNQVRWGQGVALSSSTDTTFSFDGTEGGGHYARLDIHGDNNKLAGTQTNAGSTTGHVFNSLIFSDDNDIWIKQLGNGRKTINLTTYSDGNEISLVQKGSGAEHTAYINLQGTESTEVNLIQQGTTTQAYTLAQSCYTVGGCSVTITQGTP
jgi:hypothetical protein